MLTVSRRNWLFFCMAILTVLRPWIGVCSRCWTIFPILQFIFPRRRKFAKSWITNANGTQCTVLTPMMPENLYRQWKNALKFITEWGWGWPKPFPI